MGVAFNINSDGAVVLTNKLEKLHRSALPVAIRSTLNSAAFDVKKDTMPKMARSTFEERRKNFFKANSRVSMAKGFNMKTMQSIVGFVPLSGGNEAVDELEQQEHGGVIKGRALIPIDASRVGKSNKRSVKKKNRIATMPNVVNARKQRGSSARQKFVKSVVIAGVGGLVQAEHNGREIIWRVDSLARGAGGKFKITPLYSVKKGRSVSVKPTSFMKKASMQSANKLDEFYMIEAKKQIKRLTSK